MSFGDTTGTEMIHNSCMLLGTSSSIGKIKVVLLKIYKNINLSKKLMKVKGIKRKGSVLLSAFFFTSSH